MLLQRNKGQF